VPENVPGNVARGGTSLAARACYDGPMSESDDLSKALAAESAAEEQLQWRCYRQAMTPKHSEYLPFFAVAAQDEADWETVERLSAKLENARRVVGSLRRAQDKSPR